MGWLSDVATDVQGQDFVGLVYFAKVEFVQATSESLKLFATHVCEQIVVAFGMAHHGQDDVPCEHLLKNGVEKTHCRI